MLYNVNNSFFYYDEPIYLIRDYYYSIVNLIIKILDTHPNLNINIMLCNHFNFNNSNKTIKIDINYEHTLVKKEGRDIPVGTPYGKVKDNNNPYLVRICNYPILNNADIIIDYSIPNIYNVSTCELFNEFTKKHLYITPSFYELYYTKENRNIASLSTFINTNEARRNTLLHKLKDNQINHTNINNCFEKNKLQDILKRTKILVNVHQTPHHHTFEELRVLPALECGVIVISEKSPLNELIPYNDLIIWVNYDDIVNKLKEVLDNYEDYHEKIFSIEHRNILNNLSGQNHDTLYHKIKNII